MSSKPISTDHESIDEAEKLKVLPYSFAKRNGVVLERDINGQQIVHYLSLIHI